MAQRGSSPFNVIVEGNIGCGKTTFLNYLEKYQDVFVQTEPVQQWTNFNGHNLLALMYQDVAKWGFSFESYAMLTIMQQHLQPTSRAVRLMERSLFSARYIFVEKLFNDGFLTAPGYSVLDEWFKYYVDCGQINVDLIVYLRATPEVVHERMKIRNREGENLVSLDSLKSLHQRHDDWLINKTLGKCPAPVIVLNADLDKESIIEEYKKYESDVLQLRKSISPNKVRVKTV